MTKLEADGHMPESKDVAQLTHVDVTAATDVTPGWVPPDDGWIDSHCHIQGLEEMFDRFAVEQSPSELMAQAAEANVIAAVCIGTELPNSIAAVELARSLDNVFAVVGEHPHGSKRLSQEADALYELAQDPAVVGVGEAGIDLYYEHSSLADQRRAFATQIGWAHALKKTLVIHTRDAWDETWEVLDAEGVPANTIIHCFSGGPAEAEAALERGCWISFSGVVSFPAATLVQEAARMVPLDRILVETDSPYLAPVPHRGKSNRPAWVADVGAAVSRVRDEPLEQTMRATRKNTLTAFGFGHPSTRS
jgi:TatD DNase family protein